MSDLGTELAAADMDDFLFLFLWQKAMVKQHCVYEQGHEGEGEKQGLGLCDQRVPTKQVTTEKVQFS